MRPIQLAFLELGQFEKITLNETNAYMVKGKLRAINKTSQNAKGGIRQIKDSPKEIPFFDIKQIDRKVNVYEDVDKYMRVRKNISLAEEKNN